jgi:hypothetical protein
MEELDARKALAEQWMQPGDKPVIPGGWRACLRALDILTQTARYREAVDILTAGRVANPKNPNPYTLTNADLVMNLGDWVEGAHRTCPPNKAPDCSNQAEAAFKSTQEIICDYYLKDKQGLIAKVDTNFQGKNPRRAFYELLRYEGSFLERAELEVRFAHSTLLEKQSAMAIAAQMQQDAINAGASSQSLRDAARLAADAAAAAEESLTNAKGKALNLRNKLEDIRVCYATVDADSAKDYRQKVTDFVSGLFRSPKKK